MSFKVARSTTTKASPSQPIRKGKILKPAVKPAPAPKVTPAVPVNQEELIINSRQQARKLARSILRKWNARLDLQEVDSIVDLSLCEAASRFDPSVGASFLTFMFYHLRGNLIRAISSSVNASLLPAYEAEFGNMNDEEQTEVRNPHQHGVNALEIAAALSGAEAESPDEALIKKEMLSLSKDARDKLDGLAQEVLDRIYIQEEQLIDIAYSLGYSRCHISRVKKRALETLYSDLRNALSLESEHRPDTDENETTFKLSERRKIHRRRPRSKAAKEGSSRVSISIRR